MTGLKCKALILVYAFLVLVVCLWIIYLRRWPTTSVCFTRISKCVLCVFV